MNLSSELQWREMLYGASEGLPEALAAGRVTGYIGFDPTASSLHVGSLLPIMALARLQRSGHRPIALVGGGTGLIGDPSGKNQERSLLTFEQVEENGRGLRAQLERFLDFSAGPTAAVMANNIDWLRPIGFLEFLRDVGKHFTVNYMMAKESVKRRLASDDGISFTEFSYQLLQAYDFVVLHDRFGCTLQMGGSDQWGNITAGIDLVRKMRGAKAHGLVLPLVTTAAGVKFGKTEAGTVWLDAGRTSPFRFYQFWLNTDDRDVIRYVKYFTFLERDRIVELEAATSTAPERRDAQRTLAREVTRLVHGDEAVARAELASAVLFTEDITTLAASEILAVFDDVPASDVAASKIAGVGITLVELLSSTGVTSSKSEATRLIKSGGIYVNNHRVADEKFRVTDALAIEGRLFVIRKGQKQNFLIRIAL